ncbi:hypothetical protein BC350_12215 [Ralstonia pseudosolanacearum]|nr:hypothetical protein BC350_12215 [Ralstonia pseudosolanacearum]
MLGIYMAKSTALVGQLLKLQAVPGNGGLTGSCTVKMGRLLKLLTARESGTVMESAFLMKTLGTSVSTSQRSPRCEVPTISP